VHKESVASLAISRDPISRYAKGRSSRRILWVTKTPERSWKSVDSSGLREGKKVLVECGLAWRPLATMKVPQEAWSRTKLNVAHLRTFGCIAYAYIPSELRKKLDDRSEKCIFIGYSETSKAYRLYNPLTKKLILSRDVQFLENQF
jgi:hypothetical protein